MSIDKSVGWIEASEVVDIFEEFSKMFDCKGIKLFISGNFFVREVCFGVKRCLDSADFLSPLGDAGEEG